VSIHNVKYELELEDLQDSRRSRIELLCDVSLWS